MNVINRHLHWLLVVGGVTMLGIVIGITSDDARATRAPEQPAEIVTSGELPLPIPTQNISETEIKPASVEPTGEWHKVSVKNGDNLSTLFDRNGLSPQELYRVSTTKEASKLLTRLYPGEELRLRTDNGTLTELVYDYEIGRSLNLTRSGDGFNVEIIEKPLEHRTSQAAGIINDSLFLGAQAAGLSDKLTMELAGIFGWDIDFALDIRQGDSFALLYEELYLDGEKVRDGDIIAAEFTNNGKTYQAIRYTDAEGRSDYYSADGHSMRKAFLRTPVEFSRISSRFNLSRKHPVLNTIRAHKGVDYAAATGTPIKASGDGKVIYRGVKGGYGNVVILQHGSSYSTLYGHMSKFARGVYNGSKVKQGQIIGYVGKSGLATGPHLHYEFRVNGSVRNPLTVKLPDAQPLPKKYLTDFQSRANQLMLSLNLMKRTKLALASQ